jgi:lipopolysaccharide/colanic/teichoic acid biosynthesis glycosyltransferase
MATMKPGLLPDSETEIAAASKGRHLFSALQDAFFLEMLRLERRRTERSGKPFMLVLIDAIDVSRTVRMEVFQRVAASIACCTRETDLLGWYERGKKLGLLMTEIGYADAKDLEVIARKVTDALQRSLDEESYRLLKVSFRVYPDSVTDANDSGSGKPDEVLYPDLSKNQRRRRSLTLKRTLDILGSLFAILFFLPLFLVIAVLVKLSSPGPVLFRQKRLGQYGRLFTFLKFRTMYTNNDPAIHREYVAKLIAGHQEAGQGCAVYKLKNDPRVTPLGRFLRKTSLDELPQFFNVLLNDMSLVGPRPPLPYEYERYQVWHRRRVLEMKPGLTGLWQVEGRSRTTFEEMVRLDLRYAGCRSLWMDLKIILLTPGAVLSGRGAS